MLLPLTLAVPPAPGPGAARAPRAAGQHYITRVWRSSAVSAPASAKWSGFDTHQAPRGIITNVFAVIQHHETRISKDGHFFAVVGIGSTPAPAKTAF
jgi:hypothetical protein